MRSSVDWRRRTSSILGGMLEGKSPGGLESSSGTELSAFGLSAGRLRSSSSVAGYLALPDLSHGLFEGYGLVLPALQLGFGLVVEPDVLQLLDHPLVLLDGQNDAHALAVLVHHVACAHVFSSLSL